MKKVLIQTIKIIVLCSIIFGIGIFAKDNLVQLLHNRVDAAGALTFDIGVPNGSPIFTFTNIEPGFSKMHSIKANNADTVSRVTGVKGIKTAPGILDQALIIQISHNGTTLYGPKKLSEFFADSQSANGVSLSTVDPGDQVTYDFTVTFDPTSGNVYQEQTATFDLSFGIVTELPAACQGIRFSKTIYGTAGSDRLYGTVGNDLIISFEGNDTIDGGVGNDCIISGPGNDKIQGGVGNDIIDAGSGDDIVHAGVGNDLVIGGSGDDQIYGDVGNDVLYGNEGDDRIWGGVGSDIVRGGLGDDKLVGDVGNDSLLGEEGYDSANGAVGRDTCQAEIVKACEL